MSKQSQSTYFILGLFVVGFGLLIMALIYPYYFKNDFRPDQRIGRVMRKSGGVNLILPGQQGRLVIKKEQVVQSLDSIETGEIGEALLNLSTGDKISINPQSLVTLDKDSQGRPLILLKKGEVRILFAQAASPTLIVKNGERLSLEKYTNSALYQQKAINLQNSQEYLESQKGTLTDEEIRKSLEGQKPQFFRCYTQLLQKNSQAQGRMTLNLMIESTGKLSVANIISSQLDQKDFRSCVTEVLRRVEFRSFRGDPISVLFPLEFQ